MTDALSRLRAGLDRDEAIARAAIDDSPHWIATPEGVDQVESDGRYEVVTGYFMQTRRPQANDHIALHDPSRVLRQTEALRELADEARLVLGKNDPALTDAGTLAVSVLELLASIYPEDTTDTKGE